MYAPDCWIFGGLDIWNELNKTGDTALLDVIDDSDRAVKEPDNMFVIE